MTGEQFEVNGEAIQPTEEPSQEQKTVDEKDVETPKETEKRTPKTYTQEELSKMQSTRDRQIAELNKQHAEEIAALREEMRLQYEALLEAQLSNEQPELELEDVPTKRPTPKRDAYQQFIAQRQQAEAARQSSAQNQEVIAKAQIGQAWGLLEAAGLDPNAPEIRSEMEKLLSQGKIDQLPVKAKEIVKAKREEERKQWEREFREKYGLDDEDLGVGVGSPGVDVNKLSPRDQIALGLKQLRKKKK
jgi:hypothetical protein